MSIENGMPKFLHSSGVLCVATTHGIYGAETLGGMTVDMLLLRNKSMRFGCFTESPSVQSELYDQSNSYIEFMLKR